MGASRAIADTHEIGEDGEGRSGADSSEDAALGSLSATGDGASAGNDPGGAAALRPAAEAVAARLAADRLFELTIKFVGTVGVSILRLRGQDAAFSVLPPQDGADKAGSGMVEGRNFPGGSVADRGKSSGRHRRVVYGSLDLENVTKALPLDYRLAGEDERNELECEKAGARNADVARIAQRLKLLPAGSAELVMLAGGTGTLPPASRRCVRFCILLNKFQGVFQRKISVKNVSSGRRDRDGASAGAAGSSSFSHVVRLFVDDGSVSLEMLPPQDKPSLPVLPFSRPRILSGSTPDPAGATAGLGHELQPAQQEERLADEKGSALPSLQTLSIPFMVTVAPYHPPVKLARDVALESGAVADDGGAVRGNNKDEQRTSSPKLSCFRILPVVVPGSSSNSSSDAAAALIACGETEEREDAKSDRGAIAGDRRSTGAKGPLGLSTATTTTTGDGFRGGASSPDSQGHREEESGGLVFRMTNDLDHTILLAPYSNLPVVVKAVEVANESAAAAEEHEAFGLFDFDSGVALGAVGDDRSPSLAGSGEEDRTGNSSGTSPAPRAVLQKQREETRRDPLSRCGPPLTLPAKTALSVRLSMRTGALTQPLPTAAVEGGQAAPFEGIVAWALIDTSLVEGSLSRSESMPEQVYCSDPTVGPLSNSAPPLVKLVRAVGAYCRPRFEFVGPASVDLGNVGHTTSKRGRRRFEVRLRSLCDTPVPVGLVQISPELEIRTKVDAIDGQGRDAVNKAFGTRLNVVHRRGNSVAGVDDGENCETGAQASGSRWSNRRSTDGERTDVVWIPARGETALVVQLRLSRRTRSWAGSQAFEIFFVNLADRSAEEVVVAVTARVVTQLVRIIGLDEVPPSPILRRLISPGTPTCPGPPPIRRSVRSSSIDGLGSFSTPEEGSLRLAPLAIPPIRGAAGRCFGSFQIQNVSGETVSVTLRVLPASEVAGVLCLGASLQQQDSTTGVYASAGADGRPSPSVVLLPGDLVDVNAECLALPGARLPPDLLLPLPPTAETSTAAQGSSRDAPDWGHHIRLMGTVRVEIALEDRAGDHDFLADERPEEGDGVLIESVALVGSLVPGPTFGLSQTSVTVALRPPESGGGGGGGAGHSNGTHPYTPEGPASFFVETFSQPLGPVRLKLVGGGQLYLARGVRVPAAEDEGGGRRRPAQVVKVVTAVAEPSRGTVSANGRREIAVRLIAAAENAGGPGEEAGDDGGAGKPCCQRTSENTDTAGSIPECNCDGELFVSIIDADHPGYPPQVVSVHVEVPAVISEPASADLRAGSSGGGTLGAIAGTGDGSADMPEICEQGSRMKGDAADMAARSPAEEASGQPRGLAGRRYGFSQFFLLGLPDAIITVFAGRELDVLKRLCPFYAVRVAEAASRGLASRDHLGIR